MYVYVHTYGHLALNFTDTNSGPSKSKFPVCHTKHICSSRTSRTRHASPDANIALLAPKFWGINNLDQHCIRTQVLIPSPFKTSLYWRPSFGLSVTFYNTLFAQVNPNTKLLLKHHSRAGLHPTEVDVIRVFKRLPSPTGQIPES